MPPVIWQPDREPPPAPAGKPSLLTALRRGVSGRCPVCGEGKLFAGYLRLVATCPTCATALGAARADDAPPYFTIVIVGHVIVPAILIVEKTTTLSLWTMAAIFLPLTAIVTLALLRPIKGATVATMLNFGMVARETDG